MVAFMICTGLEVEPARIARMGRQALLVAACGIAIPFAGEQERTLEHYIAACQVIEAKIRR